VLLALIAGGPPERHRTNLDPSDPARRQGHDLSGLRSFLNQKASVSASFSARMAFC
jgi:hypothetical protein